MLTSNQIKWALKRSMPKWMLDPIQRVRSGWRSPPPELAVWEGEHRRLNAGLGPEEFAFRPGIQFKIDPRAGRGLNGSVSKAPEWCMSTIFF